MSTKAVSWAIHHFNVDNPQVKLILILLAENANEDGWCWPSQESTARKAGCSRRTVIRVIQLLEKHGVIEVQQMAAGVNKTKNRYRIRLDQQFSIVTKSRKKGFDGDTESLSKNTPAASLAGRALQGGALPDGDTQSPLIGDTESRSKPGDSDRESHSKTVDGDTGVTFDGDTAVSHEPSYNHQATSNTAGVSVSTTALFAMHPNWRPSALAFQLIATRGIPETFAEDVLPEFVLYWQGRSDRHATAVQGKWDTRFHQHCVRQWEMQRARTAEPQPAPLAADWQPSNETFDALLSRGIPASTLQRAIEDFRRYWVERGLALHAWDARFHDHALQRWQQSQQHAADGNTLERFTDRSWAEETLS